MSSSGVTLATPLSGESVKDSQKKLPFIGAKKMSVHGVITVCRLPLQYISGVRMHYS